MHEAILPLANLLITGSNLPPSDISTEIQIWTGLNCDEHSKSVLERVASMYQLNSGCSIKEGHFDFLVTVSEQLKISVNVSGSVALPWPEPSHAWENRSAVQQQQWRTARCGLHTTEGSTCATIARTMLGLEGKAA
jgi:hypothetical protein